MSWNFKKDSTNKSIQFRKQNIKEQMNNSCIVVKQETKTTVKQVQGQ